MSSFILLDAANRFNSTMAWGSNAFCSGINTVLITPSRIADFATSHIFAPLGHASLNHLPRLALQPLEWTHTAPIAVTEYRNYIIENAPRYGNQLYNGIATVLDIPNVITDTALQATEELADWAIPKIAASRFGRATIETATALKSYVDSSTEAALDPVISRIAEGVAKRLETAPVPANLSSLPSLSTIIKIFGFVASLFGLYKAYEHLSKESQDTDLKKA